MPDSRPATSHPMPRVIATTVLLTILSGCASPARNAVPRELVDQATIVGMPGVRDFGDRPSAVLQRSAVESIRQVRVANGNAGFVDPDGYVNVLSLSGGGANGAFGAGLLCGWTEAGTRPKFMLVTGISTGALLSTFAFLGSDYDA
ncbi:MAG: patatin-like phospholipase family protein, partial [Phycisphaerae bacterium]